MKTAMLKLPLLLLPLNLVFGADNKPAPPPTIASLEEQQKVVNELSAKLKNAQKELKRLEKTFTDPLDATFAKNDAASRIVEPIAPELYADRYNQYTNWKSDQAEAAKKNAIKEKTYFPFQIRKSVIGQSAKVEPAQATWVSNQNGKDSFAVDSSLLLDVPEWSHKANLGFGESDRVEFAPFVEYHRNTSGSAPTDALVAGLRTRLILDRGDELSDFFQYIDLTSGFSRMKLTEGSGFFADLTYTPLLRGYHIGTFGPTRFRSGGLERDQIRLTPSLAASYKNVFDGNSEAFEGTNFVVKAGAEIEYFPKAWVPDALEDHFVFKLGYKYFNYLSHTDSVAIPDETLHYFHASIDYYLDSPPLDPEQYVNGKSGHFAIGLEYTKGDNPETGAFDEDQVKLSLKVLF